MLDTFKIKHMKTAYHVPQPNASESVNQSVLAAIRANLETDHRDWDMHLPEIECAIRTPVDSSAEITPYFALIGQSMNTCGEDYKLARRLGTLDDTNIEHLDRTNKMKILRDTVAENMHKTFDRCARQYNKIVRNITFQPVQEVY